MQNNLPKPTIASATSTLDLILALIGSDNEVSRKPQPITPDMPYYVAQTNRILWERWEAAAIALNNVRSEEIVCDRQAQLNRRRVARIRRAFPGIDKLFPADYFELEYDETDFDVTSNYFEGVCC